MDDLNTLATLLTKPEPSSEAITRSRERLQDRARGRARRRIGWLVPGLGLATAAAAAVAVIATGVVTPAGAPASGREVLLMAAASAERTPQGSGTYWHVEREWSNVEIPRVESWTGRDGRRWTKGEPGDSPDVVVPARTTLMLKGAEVSFEDLERLPADPEALKARIAEIKGPDSDMSESEQRDDSLFPLMALISELPTPPEVRSAAFRALAATPGVENTGAVEGGQELLIPGSEEGDETKLVVDPETAQVSRTNFLITAEGGVASSNGFIRVTTGWTDQPPQ
ncbi:CU044_5270 family protein [Streptosporangium sp. NBC_01469]|uniref:CU044_5270 family protein n=1 Tax=Streptosporangium sp. NBC_01469 TaxID=2903898 RepID=UPI002E2A210C|nr:CU044_5270 family protein [Streptosporangium sp. NBC_01469]